MQAHVLAHKFGAMQAHALARKPQVAGPPVSLQATPSSPPQQVPTVRLLQDWNIKCDGLELDAFPRALFEKGSKVKELILSKNRIPTVPPEVSQLCSLRTLKLDCNAITHIPPEIGMLSELQLLDLSSNNLAAVPLELGTLYMLKYVNLLDNPLQVSPPDMYTEGCHALNLDLAGHKHPAIRVPALKTTAPRVALRFSVLENIL
eukprot:1158318-Pelagomonas_calceolata.AAC.2